MAKPTYSKKYGKNPKNNRSNDPPEKKWSGMVRGNKPPAGFYYPNKKK